MSRKTIYFDETLHLEAYHLIGYIQKFPPHFHDYYVVGLVESGRRLLKCKQQEWCLHEGDIVLFNPYEVHGCQSVEDELLNYQGINIPKECFQKVVEELYGEQELPFFKDIVIQHPTLKNILKELFRMVFEGETYAVKQEQFHRLVQLLLPFMNQVSLVKEECVDTASLEAVVVDMEQNYLKKLNLSDLLKQTTYQKSHFIRQFTKEFGMTPIRYLLSLRIQHAKKMLENEVSLSEVAFITNFFDQSHFSNTFKSFIGVTPRQYQQIFLDRKEVSIN